MIFREGDAGAEERAVRLHRRLHQREVEVVGVQHGRRPRWKEAGPYIMGVPEVHDPLMLEKHLKALLRTLTFCSVGDQPPASP
jgi:hypothetical protein